MRPGCADAPDDPLDFLGRAGAAVDVGLAQLGDQEMPAAKYIQRQIAVAVIVAVKEAALLIAVQRIAGRVGIEDDLFRRPFVRLDEEIDEQSFDRVGPIVDLVIAARRLHRALQTVQRRFARDRRAIGATGRELAGERRKQRIVAQRVVIVQIFVAERQTDQPLSEKRFDLVLDQHGIATIDKAGRKALRQPQRFVDLSQQQRASVRGQRPAIETRLDPTPFRLSKIELPRVTVRLHRARRDCQHKCL